MESDKNDDKQQQCLSYICIPNKIPGKIIPEKWDELDKIGI